MQAITSVEQLNNIYFRFIKVTDDLKLNEIMGKILSKYNKF
jgi:hypothetical protein